MAISVITLVLLFLSLAWAVVARAGVWASDWEVSLALAAVGAIVFATGNGKERMRMPWPAVVLFAVPGYIVLTLIPLPMPILALLSPARAVLLARLQPVMPSITSAPLSVNPPATLLSLFTILGCIITFLLISGIAVRMRSKPWITAIPLLVLAVFEAGLGLFQVFTGSSPVAIGTYTNRDHFSGFLEMVFPFAFLFGLALFKSHTGQMKLRSALAACGLWGVTVLMFLAVAYSLSRMGFLVVLVELLIVGTAGVAGRIKSRWRWLTVSALSATLVAGCIFLTPDKLSARFATISVAGKSPTELRLAIWKDTLPLISEFPVFGCGMGGYESVFLRHQSAANEYGVEFAHNDYLQFIAELGMVGFVPLAVVIGGICWGVVRALTVEVEESRRLVLWSSLAALGGMLLHSTADFNMYIPANAMTFAWIAGIGAATAMEPTLHRRSRPSR